MSSQLFAILSERRKFLSLHHIVTTSFADLFESGWEQKSQVGEFSKRKPGVSNVKRPPPPSPPPSGTPYQKRIPASRKCQTK